MTTPREIAAAARFINDAGGVFAAAQAVVNAVRENGTSDPDLIALVVTELEDALEVAKQSLLDALAVIPALPRNDRPVRPD